MTTILAFLGAVALVLGIVNAILDIWSKLGESPGFWSNVRLVLVSGLVLFVLWVGYADAVSTPEQLNSEPHEMRRVIGTGAIALLLSAILNAVFCWRWTMRTKNRRPNLLRARVYASFALASILVLVFLLVQRSDYLF